MTKALLLGVLSLASVVGCRGGKVAGACVECVCSKCDKCDLDGNCSCKMCNCDHVVKDKKGGSVSDGHDNGGGGCSGGSCSR